MNINTQSTSHRSLLRKAELSLSDLQTDGGYMNPEQAKQFIRAVVKQSQLLSQIYVHPMKSHTTELNLVKFGDRVLRPGTPGAALLPGDRVKPTTNKVNIVSELFKAEVDLQDEVLEDNIESGNFKNTVLQLVSERASLDIEDVVVNGDVLSLDPTLAVMDGVRKLTVSNQHDFAGNDLNADDLSDLIRAWPIRYRKMKKDARILTSHNAEQDYRHSLAQRGTVAGDKFLLEGAPVLYAGVPIMPLDVWPEDLGAGNDQTDAILCPLKNIVLGFWRKIKVEIDRDVREGKYIIVLTVRFGVNLVEEEANVKGHTIQL